MSEPHTDATGLPRDSAEAASHIEQFTADIVREALTVKALADTLKGAKKFIEQAAREYAERFLFELIQNAYAPSLVGPRGHCRTAVRGSPSTHGQTRASGHSARPTREAPGGDGLMIPFVFPVLLLVAFLMAVAVREAWRLVPAGTARGRAARAGSVIVGVIAVVVVARLLVAPLPSERALTWKAGFAFDPWQARATVVRVEVERPSCAPDGDGWIAPPVVAYTPLAVFITVRMADTFNVPGCTGTLGHNDGLLPLVGGYLTGTYLNVQLTEPLGGRGLFDGSGLLPEPRLPVR